MTDPWAERAKRSDQAYLDYPDRGEGEESPFVHWAQGHLGGGIAGGSRPEIVEAGCGRGRDAAWLALEGYRVRGVDLSEVAIERAIERQRALAEPARSRLTFVLGEAARYVEGLSPGSIDAVVAHLVYPTWQPPEVDRWLAAVHRALRPRGLHLFSVRGVDDPLEGRGTQVGPHTWIGGPHLVPYRYYAAADLDAFTHERFERVETLHSPDTHLYFVADRRREHPPAPPPAPRGR